MFRRLYQWLRWKLFGKTVISTVGPTGQYPTLTEWQETRGGNLVKRNTKEIAVCVSDPIETQLQNRLYEFQNWLGGEDRCYFDKYAYSRVKLLCEEIAALQRLCRESIEWHKSVSSTRVPFMNVFKKLEMASSGKGIR